MVIQRKLGSYVVVDCLWIFLEKGEEALGLGCDVPKGMQKCGESRLPCQFLVPRDWVRITEKQGSWISL